MGGPTATLLSFLRDLGYADLPAPVVSRTEELFVDWIGSALAGSKATPVAALRRFAQTMGPQTGASELIGAAERTSPLFAALVNAAASHAVEQDDLHNRSVLHPGTVVFPAALAAAQAVVASGPAFLTAVAAGYEAGTRVGEMLGRSHYQVFHTTGTAGTVGAAVAVAHLLRLDSEAFTSAVGSAGTQAAGLWAFLRDAAHSKQLHSAKAAADGLLSAYTAQAGLTGARDILLGAQGMATAMSTDANPDALLQDLGKRWAVCETSFKWHASCRHTHPAADAMLQLVTEHDLTIQDIVRINAGVYQAAIDVLGPVRQPQTVHQSKFCMGFVLALIARHRRASIDLFTDENLRDPELRGFAGKVAMSLDPAIDDAYPGKWMSTVELETRDGRVLRARVESAKGDPDKPLTREEIKGKAIRLGQFGCPGLANQIQNVVDRVYQLHHFDARIEPLFNWDQDAARQVAG